MNSNEVQNKINQYRTALNKVITVKNNIISSINTLNSISDTQNKCYKKDDECVTGSYLSDLLEKEKDVLSNIDNNIIPNINRMINNLGNQYKDLKIKEQLESEAGLNG